MVIHDLHASVLHELKQYSQYIFCLSMSAPAQNAFDITFYQAFWLHCTAFVRSLHGSSCCGNDLMQRKSLVDDGNIPTYMYVPYSCVLQAICSACIDAISHKHPIQFTFC